VGRISAAALVAAAAGARPAAASVCPGGPAISIASVARDNPATSLTGLYVTVQQMGAIVAAGWTPFTAPDLCAGQEYTITAADYRNNRFAQWDDGTLTWWRTIHLQDSASLVAHYQVGGSIIPLYEWPTDIAGNVTPPWNAAATAHRDWPTVAVIPVVNNQNGPGPAPDPSWTKGIDVLVGGGCKVAGYVYTQYGQRPLAAVEADISNWRAWYPQVTALFVDQMSNTAGNESYYSAVTAFAKSRGFDFVIGNPGASTVASYIGTVDTMVVSESASVPTSFPAWQASFSPNNFAALSYAIAAFPTGQISENKASVAYQYVTQDGVAPDTNPWDDSSIHLDVLLSLLTG